MLMRLYTVIKNDTVTTAKNNYDMSTTLLPIINLQFSPQ